MADEQVSDRILTIPNIVSFLRLAGVPLFWWVLLVDDNVALAAWIIFIIGWTDWVDGYLARRLNQVSKLGKTLDPVADRLMIGSAIVGGLIAGVLPGVIGWPLIIREVFMAVLTLFLAARGAGVLDVRYVGKQATFALYGAIPAFYLAEAGFLTPLMEPVAWCFGVIGVCLYWFATIPYIGDARVALRQLESAPNP